MKLQKVPQRVVITLFLLVLLAAASFMAIQVIFEPWYVKYLEALFWKSGILAALMAIYLMVMPPFFKEVWRLDKQHGVRRFVMGLIYGGFAFLIFLGVRNIYDYVFHGNPEFWDAVVTSAFGLAACIPMMIFGFIAVYRVVRGFFAGIGYLLDGSARNKG